MIILTSSNLKLTNYGYAYMTTNTMVAVWHGLVHGFLRIELLHVERVHAMGHEGGQHWPVHGLEPASLAGK